MAKSVFEGNGYSYVLWLQLACQVLFLKIREKVPKSIEGF